MKDHIITRGFGGVTAITRGYGFGGIYLIIKTEFVRLVSRIRTAIELRSEL